MSNDDRLYIKSVKKKVPTLDVFKRMVQILTNMQKEVDRLSLLAQNIKDSTV